MKKENKTYNLETLYDFLDVVNDDNIDVLIQDFYKFLVIYNISIKEIRTKLPKESKGKRNLELLKSEFIWNDDGVSEIKEINFINETTGETKTIYKK